MTYFDARALPAPTDEYVAWIDIMGIQRHMAHSISSSANFVFKLHVAALDSPHDGVSIYPVMDGFYATSATKQGIEAFMRAVLASLANVFADEEHQHFRFIARGAIAFGKVYHGRNIGDTASKRLAENPNYRAAILLGEPIIHACQTERDAPPFGIAVHQSARESAPTGDAVFSSVWWNWYTAEFDKAHFRACLAEYYDWCRRKSAAIGYAPERILVHEGLAMKYFS